MNIRNMTICWLFCSMAISRLRRAASVRFSDGQGWVAQVIYISIYSMISISFLRTLNPKKYQDYAQENRNRLRVYYIRTINKINRLAKLNKEPIKVDNRCLCRHGKCKASIYGDWSGDQRDSRSKDGERDRDGGKESQGRRKYEAKNIVLDFEATRLQCQKKMEKIQKQNFMESRKLACLNHGRRTIGRKQQSCTNFHKPTTARQL